MGGRSSSSSTKTTEVTDQRVGVSSGPSSVVLASSGSGAVSSSIVIRDISPAVIDKAIRELTDLSELTIEEAFEFADRAAEDASNFAAERGRDAAQVQKEALRIVETVIEREQEPGVSSARAALLAGVAVVGLVAFSGGFK